MGRLKLSNKKMKMGSKGDRFAKNRWSKVHKELIPKVRAFAEGMYGDIGLQEAWQEFHLWQDPSEFDFDHQEAMIFVPWFLFHWIPELEKTKLKHPLMVPLAEDILMHFSDEISDDEYTYLSACCEAPLSFYQINQVDPGIGLKLKDLLRDKEFYVLEYSAAQTVKPGMILFAQVIEVEGHCFLEGICPYPFDASESVEVVFLKHYIQKQFRKITAETLFEYDMEIRDLYWRLLSRLLAPVGKRLGNTDGHLMVPHILTYWIRRPLETFNGLKSLAHGLSEEELLADAEIDDDGEIHSANLPWYKKPTKKNPDLMKILLARIQIENNQMVVELNSRERVRAFKRQLKKLLPDDSYRLIDTRIETVEEHFDRRDLQESSEPESDVDTNVDLANDPEIKETMRKHFEAHYMKWITDKIPALNNARPIDLVRTKKGRELVESMISSFEFRLMQRPIPNCSPEIFKKMRERLGL